MSESKVINAERRMRGAIIASGGSIDGYNWLETALDPFHDKAVKPTGYPDTQSAASVTQLVKQSMQISAPSGIGSTQTWDCNLTSLPMVSISLPNKAYVVSVLPTLDGSGYSSSVINTGPLGVGFGTLQPAIGLTAYTGPTGSLMGVATNPTPAGVTFQTLQLPAPFWSETARIVGIGFEVHNTTAEIYKQGTVCVWRQPINPYTTGTARGCFNSANVGFAAADFCPMPQNPPSLSQALLLYGSRQWAAKDGCYVVNTFNSTENPVNISNTTQPLFYVNTPNDVAQYTYAGIPAAGGGNNWGYPTTLWANINMSGAIFTGLSAQTTLTVNYNIYVERFPATSNNDLITLATPSAAFDPRVLEIYASVARSLPPGVPVSENGLGDWFSGVASAVATTVGQVSKAVAPILLQSRVPAAQALGGAMTLGTMVADNYRSRVPRAPPMVVATIQKPRKQKTAHAAPTAASVQRARASLNRATSNNQSPNTWRAPQVPNAPPLATTVGSSRRRR
jgi:hypothetical protein